MGKSVVEKDAILAATCPKIIIINFSIEFSSKISKFPYFPQQVVFSVKSGEKLTLSYENLLKKVK